MNNVLFDGDGEGGVNSETSPEFRVSGESSSSSSHPFLYPALEKTRRNPSSNIWWFRIGMILSFIGVAFLGGVVGFEIKGRSSDSSNSPTATATVSYTVSMSLTTTPTASPSPSGSLNYWSSVASSADGSKLVAAAIGGPIYTSTNSGISWTPFNIIAPWSSVASSADGSKLVAVASNVGVFVSVDSGVSWIPTNTYQNLEWLSVASSADGSKVVAVAAPFIYTSTNFGLDWKPGNFNNDWTTVASSADGSKLIAGSDKIYTSVDYGETWVVHNLPGGNWKSVASSADGCKLVAVPNAGPIFTSNNSGLNWTQSKNTDICYWNSVASSADGSKLIVVGSYYLQDPNDCKIFTSIDYGVSWELRNPLRGGLFLSVSSSADGTKLVVVIQNEPGIITSADSGVTWKSVL